MPGELGNLNTKNWENLETLADSLEQAWKAGCPDINEFLPPPGAASRPVILQELIKTDMECRWRNGQAIVLDYYLEKFAADLGPIESLPAPLIYEEYRVRQLFGDHPPLAPFQKRFPKQFAELERLIRENPLPSAGGPAASRQHAQNDTGRAERTNVERTNIETKGAGSAAAFFGKNAVLAQTGGYTLMERIGTGGFAEVWKAQAPGGFLKAIKIIVRPIDQEEAQREKESMDLIKGLRHHFLLPVHMYWALEDRLIILMDLADGSLRDCLNKYRKEGKPAIPLPELMRYMRQSAEALDYLHEKKVQHRDIKPENILLTEGNVRVADFGLAKAQGTQRMVSGTFAGTPLYMPPETWEDKTHIHGDQYSLAATFYELRSGSRLYKDAGLPALMHNHLHEAPRLEPLGKEEQRVLLRALAKNPEDRYPDCLTFVNALQKAVARELPSEGAALPAVPGSPTATDATQNTIAPGADATATITATTAETPRPAGIAPAGKTQPSWLVRGIAALLVVALIAFPAWLVLHPSPEQGELTLMPVEPQTLHAGQTRAIAITIQRDRFAEAVQVKLAADPYLSIQEVTVPPGSASAEVKLTAAAQTPPGRHRATLEVCGGAHCAYLALDVTITTK